MNFRFLVPPIAVPSAGPILNVRVCGGVCGGPFNAKLSARITSDLDGPTSLEGVGEGVGEAGEVAEGVLGEV